ncbi:16S rRNA (cytosine(967)-C(5))-methyltransferase RsmB [Litorivicinus lipolyticus]|uniref:16S rRNA (cytosine(967)-C(5))-methyltransferase RsmB n=1 Tax=Litorivicinus lipolyticus TaxID=418701 RepID=UPI003B5C53F2
MSNTQAARWLALNALDAVVNGSGSLDANLAKMAADDLAPAERSLARMIASVTARHWFQLDAVLTGLMPKALREKDQIIRTLVLTGLGQLAHSRQAEYAVVTETVALTKRLKRPWARGLVNGVLRNYLRERPRWDAHHPDAVAYYNHPQWLIDAVRAAWPAQRTDIFAANNRRAAMVLRVNQRRFSRDDYLDLLAASQLPAQRGIAPDAIVLDEPINVHQLPQFADGAVSVQDTSAQWAAGLMDLKPGQHVLDACAAPGGKTCHLLERQDLDCLAIDLVESRLGRVHENLARLGLNAQVECHDAAEPIDGQFDRILVDAPCSGTGVIRRHPDIRLARDPQQVADNSALSLRILNNLWTNLKPGGRLVYATCSILPDENDTLVARFVKNTVDAQVGDCAIPGGIPQSCGSQILPGDDDVDGFYYAVLLKSPEHLEQTE